MRHVMLARVVGLLLLFCATLVTAGTNVSIDGNASYQVLGSSVTISVDQVTNNTLDTTSGTLFLVLWATTGSSPVDSGYELAVVELGTLQPGYYYYDIVQNAAFTSPPDGTYYVHLLLTEYPNVNTIIDSVTFGTSTFGGDGGSVSSGALTLDGNASYQVDGSSVTITLDQLTNNGSTTSGDLHLVLWATATSAPEGSGYDLAKLDLPALQAGFYYYDIQRTVAYTPPPDGVYYVHLLLTQEPDPNTIVDSITFGTSTFSSGSSSVSDGSSSLKILGDVVPVYRTDGYIDKLQFNGEATSQGTISIINEGTSSTGMLKIRMVATSTPYSGGTLSGYRMLDYDLLNLGISNLQPGAFLADFTVHSFGTLDSHPDYGQYYTYVLLIETGTDGGEYIRDYKGLGFITLGCGVTDACLADTSPTTDAPPSDEGGGGALNPLLLWLLAGYSWALAVANGRNGRRRQ